MMNAYKELTFLFNQYYQLQHIEQIMNWDESVMMPEGAGEIRASVMGTLNRITHKTLLQKKIPQLFQEAEQDSTLSTWDAANLQWMKNQNGVNV